MRSLKTVFAASLLTVLILTAPWVLSATRAVSWHSDFVTNAPRLSSGSTPVWLWAGGGRLFDVTLAGDYGWLAGWYGTVGHTTDGGVTWAGQYAGRTDLSIYGVTAIDASHAWAAGYDGYSGAILHTDDGGASWTEQASNANWSFDAGDITFVDASHGWAVGTDWGAIPPQGLILHTSDGGTTWATQTSGTDQSLYSVAFTDVDHGWAVGGNGTILHTANGGSTWTDQTSGTTEQLNDVFALDANHAWAVGTNWSAGPKATILRTIDGGSTWIQATDTVTNTLLNAVAFADANNGWAVGGDGVILHTTDGGNTWTAQDSGVPYDYALNGIAVRNTTEAVVVGEHGALLRTSDAGSTWSSWSPIATLRDVAFTSADEGWIVGWDETIAHTTDGGRSWTLQDPGVAGADLYGLSFVDDQNGYTVGVDGSGDSLILRTTNGGAWTRGTVSPVHVELYGVEAWDATHAWAGGTRYIYATSNGITWAQQYDQPWYFHSLDFVSATEGWVVGERSGGYGKILHTADGGATWTSQWENISPLGLRDVAFWDAQTGWAVGEGASPNTSLILRTSDGGATWDRGLLTGLYKDLESVAFTSASEGWAVGESATILHTADGGASGAAEAVQSGAHLYGVATTGTDLWAAGDYSTILKRAIVVETTPTPTSTSSPLATSTPTGTSTGTPTPTATSTLPPIPTDTATPTPTYTPTPTSTSTPTSTPRPEELPDLVITDVWNGNGQICYQVRNAGAAAAPKGHYTALSVDDQQMATDLVDTELAPGERLTGCFDYQWQCTMPKDIINVCADLQAFVLESDETNNCREETWQCDTTPPAITSGPTVSEIGVDSAIVSWQTDEESDSLVKYGRQAGEYEDQAGDVTPSKGHEITLTDLKPSTTYHYVVESKDASDNAVASDEGFFQTAAASDSTKPDISFLAATSMDLPPEFTALASDNIGVERLEFYLDGEYVQADYSAPYQIYLDPAYMGMTRTEFFQDHTFEARAYDPSGMVTTLSSFFTPYRWCALGEFDFRAPRDGYTVFTDDVVAPADTWINVWLDVSETEWEYGRVPGHPDIETIVGEPVERVEFWIDGTQVYSSTAALTMHEYDWDASGISLGDHTVVAKAYSHDGCVQTERHTVRVVRPRPMISVSRDVTRVGNYFQVNLRIENEGTEPAEYAYIDDLTYSSTMAGFQSASKATADYSVSSHYSVDDQRSENYITLIDTPYELEPGGHLTISYLAVPILYPETADYRIDAATTEVEYHDVYGDPYRDAFTHSAEEGDYLTGLVDEATGGSDYLLVTNPYNLFGLNGTSPTDRLLGKMAELASLRNGVLGYFHIYVSFMTEFDASDLLTTGNTLGAPRGEIILAEDEEDVIRLYDGNRQLFEEQGDHVYIPIEHSGLHENDAIAAGDVLALNPLGEDPAGTSPAWDEILVADGDGAGEGDVTIYQFWPRFTFYNVETTFATSYNAGDGFAVGDIQGDNEAEIIVANADDGTIDVYDQAAHGVWTRETTFSSGFEHSNLFAVGDVVGDAKAEIIIGDVSDGRIFVYAEDGTELLRHSRVLDANDTLAVGDIRGSEKEEILVISEGGPITWYAYDTVRGSMSLDGTHDHFFGARDVLTVGDALRSGKDEVIIAYGRGGHGHTTGEVNALSFAFSVGEMPGDRQALDRLINEGGEWAERLSEDWTSEGYLLIVGEAEIVPAFSVTWDLYFSDHGSVDYTDRNYASTAGDTNYPELSIGRIIGNNAERLQNPIQASIDVARGDREFDNSDAYAVTGPARGASGEADRIDFTANRNSVARSLRGEGYVVEESHRPTQTGFFVDAQNQDVIFLGGHGSEGSISVLEGSDSLGWNEVWDNFNPRDARPLVYAASCSTGRYSDGISLAEAFLFRDASGYVGATEVAIWRWAGRLAENYFGNLEPGKTVGAALKHAKRHRLGVNTYSWDPGFNRYTCAAFHLYGDPKLEPTWLSTSAAELRMTESSLAETSSRMGPVPSVDVTIPDYQVTTVDGEDHVEIPGGGVVLVPDKPIVPSYNVVIDYPKGHQIQSVALTKRSGLITDTGLNIPVVVPAIAGEEILEAQQVPQDSEWWPDRDFEWTTIQNPDDTTTLIITIYPFRYNASTTGARFYKNVTFDIQSTTSDFEITGLLAERHVYEPGQAVVANVYLLSSADQPVDVIVDAKVRSGASDEFVQGLPLRTLKNVRGFASFAVEWDSTGAAPGNYVLGVTVRDVNGGLLDRATQEFVLGTSAGKITHFSATPDYFDVGASVAVSLTVDNVGTVVISGTAVIKVQDEAGETVQEFTHAIADLAPAGTVNFEDVWDTSGIEEGSYRMVAYILYDGKATSPTTVQVGTPLTCYDFDRDGQVDVDDVQSIASRWRLKTANPDPDNDENTPNYEDQYDVVYDGIIDIRDIMTVAATWGEQCS